MTDLGDAVIAKRRRSPSSSNLNSHRRKTAVKRTLERRRARSTYRGEAADLYLDELARRYELRAAVLSDELGLPIAAAGPKYTHEPLSAYGAFKMGQTEAALERSQEAGPRCIALNFDSRRAHLTILGSGRLPLDGITCDLARILGF